MVTHQSAPSSVPRELLNGIGGMVPARRFCTREPTASGACRRLLALAEASSGADRRSFSFSGGLSSVLLLSSIYTRLSDQDVEENGDAEGQEHR
jgi:hypothetical protein